jgi:hypothetical protein
MISLLQPGKVFELRLVTICSIRVLGTPRTSTLHGHFLFHSLSKFLQQKVSLKCQRQRREKVNTSVTCMCKSQRCLFLKTEIASSPHNSIELGCTYLPKRGYRMETKETRVSVGAVDLRDVAFHFRVSHLYQEVLLSSFLWLLSNDAAFRQGHAVTYLLIPGTYFAPRLIQLR